MTKEDAIEVCRKRGVDPEQELEVFDHMGVKVGHIKRWQAVLDALGPKHPREG